MRSVVVVSDCGPSECSVWVWVCVCVCGVSVSIRLSLGGGGACDVVIMRYSRKYQSVSTD